MSLNTKNKSMLRNGLSIVIGSLSCIFFFIPLLLALTLSGIHLIDPQNMTYLHILPFEVVAFGASGFIMSIIISFISRDKKISTALFGALIVTIFCIAHGEMIRPFYELPQKWKYYFSLETGVCIISLWFFCYLGAWLVSRKNKIKAASQSRTSANEKD